MHKERKTAKETFVLIKTGFPFPEREFGVEKHFFKTGLTFLFSILLLGQCTLASKTKSAETMTPQGIILVPPGKLVF